MEQLIMTGEALPRSDEAEKAVLGSLLLEPALYYEIAAIIKAEDFFLEKNKIVYKVLQRLSENDEEIDLITVTEALRVAGVLETIGGALYLTELCDSVSAVFNAPAYARTIRDKSIKRQLIYLNKRMSEEASKGEKRAEEILDDEEAEIYALNQLAEPTALKQVGEFITEAYDNIGKEEKGIPTYIELDNLIGGLKKGEMIIVAARPGMGKTTFCLNLAEQAATKYNKTVAFFTLEMTAVQVAARMLYAKAKVDIQGSKNGKELADEDFAKLADAMDEISHSNLYIDDTSMITVAEIRGKVRKLQKEHGLDMVVVDYIGLMQAPNNQYNQSRQQQISEISRQLKGLAKEMNVPVVVISQLNRASVSKANSGGGEGNVKEPDLSHLRESGALEQDADIVLFIHRPYYYDKTQEEALAKIIVAKNRNGAVGTAYIGFMSRYTLFINMDFDHIEDGPPVDEEPEG